MPTFLCLLNNSMGLSCVLGHNWEHKGYTKGYSQLAYFAGTDMYKNYGLRSEYICTKCLKSNFKKVASISKEDYENKSARELAIESDFI